MKKLKSVGCVLTSFSLVKKKFLWTVRENNAIYTSVKKHAYLVKINYVIIINILKSICYINVDIL